MAGDKSPQLARVRARMLHDVGGVAFSYIIFYLRPRGSVNGHAAGQNRKKGGVWMVAFVKSLNTKRGAPSSRIMRPTMKV